jgi:hypothetical protein
LGVAYSDEDIAQFLSERKPLPPKYRSRLKLRPKSGHGEHELDVVGDAGTHFKVILRQSNANPFDFSVMLTVCPPTSTRVFRVRRHNGKSHEHTNVIEGSRFYDFHVHQATQRYQELGVREDTYAEPTDRYADVWGALECLFEDCRFVKPDDPQAQLLEVP